MLSSVEITIGGEPHTLQFLAGDIIELEDSLDKPMRLIMAMDYISRIGVISRVFYYGLKKGFDSRGNPKRELSQDLDGMRQAQEYARLYTSGKPTDAAAADIGLIMLKALAAGEWYNANALMKEADTSVPQGNDTPKNSEDHGSRLPNR
jgi:hypothetical protein